MVNLEKCVIYSVTVEVVRHKMCDISVTVEVDRHMQWPNLLVLNPDHGKGSDEG